VSASSTKIGLIIAVLGGMAYPALRLLYKLYVFTQFQVGEYLLWAIFIIDLKAGVRDRK
jgi:hypothetical protein